MKKIQLKRMTVLAVMSAMLFALSQPFAMAEEEGYVGDDTVSFGPRASYFNPKGSGDEEWTGGAQLRVFLAKALAIEGSIDYRREESGETEVHVFPVQASLLAYILPRKPFSVFVLGGAGWYYTQIDPPSPADEQTDHRFGAHAGAGAQAFLSEDWSIDGSYRYIWLEDVSSTDQQLVDKDFDDSGSQITMALNYHF